LLAAVLGACGDTGVSMEGLRSCGFAEEGSRMRDWYESLRYPSWTCR
jgi:hypothetical protein